MKNATERSCTISTSQTANVSSTLCLKAWVSESSLVAVSSRSLRSAPVIHVYTFPLMLLHLIDNQNRIWSVCKGTFTLCLCTLSQSNQLHSAPVDMTRPKALETVAYAINLAYNSRNAFPFSTYGETFFLAIQNVIITLLIIHLAPQKGAVIGARPLSSKRNTNGRKVLTGAVITAATGFFLWSETLCPLSLRRYPFAQILPTKSLHFFIYSLDPSSCYPSPLSNLQGPTNHDQLQVPLDR